MRAWTTRHTAVLTALFIHATALDAWAQKPVSPPADQGGTLQWLVAMGIMVVIGITAFLNPKRSHLN